MIFAWKDNGHHDSELVPACYVAIFADNWNFARFENLSQRLRSKAAKAIILHEDHLTNARFK
jgi:hypothetical protein